MTSFIVIAAIMALAAAAAVAVPLLRNGQNRLVPVLSALSIVALSGLLYMAWTSWD